MVTHCGDGGSGVRGVIVAKEATGDIGSGERVLNIGLLGGVGGSGDTVSSRWYGENGRGERVEARSGRHISVPSLSSLSEVSTVLAGRQGMESVEFLRSGIVRVEWR